MDSTTKKRLEEMAARAERDYAGIKADAERRVVRWEWADFARYSLNPAYFEGMKFTRGKVIPGEPNPPEGAFGYGYDAKGRIVVERQQTEFPGLEHETFYEHEADGIRAYRFDYFTEKEWQAVDWFALQDGRAIAVESLSYQGNAFGERYQYNEKGHMIHHEQVQYNGSSAEVTLRHELEYDAKGRIDRIYRYFGNGPRELHYERATPKMSLKARKKELLRGLTAAIIDGMRNAAITDEVYVLVVRYSETALANMLPPCIGLNTVPERERLLREHPEDLQYLWNPCEWLPNHCDMIYHLPPDVEALCAAVNQDIWQNERYEHVRLFLNELLVALYKANLPIRRCEDFAAIGLIVEDGGCDVQVKEQMPARVRNSFMKKGWLPR